ncbi:MAG: M28 family peptidase [Oscillospiraceae bacterium]|jgi:hypothetical protein|nr:M28 family peptidase [Oscillospiraceae bacterium]
MPKVILENPRKSVAESTMKYMLDGIRYVCATFTKRKPGSQSERNAQAYFKTELEGYADNVVMEDFSLHPDAFMGFIPIAAVFILAGVACFWLGKGSLIVAILGALLPLLSTLMFLFEFLFYRSFVDFLFPKKISRNVYATRKPSGEVKQRIIFGGHTDAAYEWTYSYLGEVAGLAFAIFTAVASMIVGLVANLVRLVYVIAEHVTLTSQQIKDLTAIGQDPFKLQGGWLGWGIALLCTIPFGLIICKFINYKIVVDGANDNLTANYISMSILKEMAEADMRFEHTEVGCLLSGSEEAGLRGAKAFAKKHQKEFSKADSGVETIFIALDTMREIDEMRVCNFGCTGTMSNDRAVGDLLHAAGEACGVKLPDSELYPGAVDAEAFSMFGLRSTGFTAVSHEARRYYHTRQDTADNVDSECMALSFNICKEAARIFDEQGMAQFDAARAK